MAELIPMNGVWAVLLTCAAYQFDLFCRKKTGTAICNPVLIAAIIVIIFLYLFCPLCLSPII